MLRFEVTEDPSPGVDGQRFSHTPQLGLWSGAMSANGDIVVGEMRLRSLMADGADALFAELDSVLGTAWDEALEPYRDGGHRRRGELAQPRRGVASAAFAERETTAKNRPIFRRQRTFGAKDLQRAADRRDLDRQRHRELAVGVGVDARALDTNGPRAVRLHLVEMDVRALEHGGEQPHQLGA